MNKKILLQIFIVIVVLTVSFVFYDSFLKKNTDKTISKQIERKNEINKDGNYIKNLTYKSKDAKNRQYIIKSESGYIDKDKPEIIYMENVKAIVKSDSQDPINVSSKTAIYNNLNYDTKFENGIKMTFLDHMIVADNLNFSYLNNKLEAFNNLTYSNQNSIIYADKIELNLLTKNTKIYNFDESKIKIIFFEKKNGDNQEIQN
ncbi:hypothetical protein HIMB5_00011640 [alpha proteobacterium HIMB5]|nr:hypothetical protein HIMB5_00011640 [alpha proteobacterium HIMB5]